MVRVRSSVPQRKSTLAPSGDDRLIDTNDNEVTTYNIYQYYYGRRAFTTNTYIDMLLYMDTIYIYT